MVLVDSIRNSLRVLRYFRGDVFMFYFPEIFVWLIYIECFYSTFHIIKSYNPVIHIKLCTTLKSVAPFARAHCRFYFFDLLTSLRLSVSLWLRVLMALSNYSQTSNIFPFLNESTDNSALSGLMWILNFCRD